MEETNVATVHTNAAATLIVLTNQVVTIVVVNSVSQVMDEHVTM